MTMMNKIKKIASEIKTNHIVIFLSCLTLISFFLTIYSDRAIIIYPSDPYQIPSDKTPLNYSVDFISHLDNQNSIIVINSSAVSVLDKTSHEISWQYQTNWTINSHNSLISINQNAILLAGEFVSFIEIGAPHPQWTFNQSGEYAALSISKKEHLFTFRDRDNSFVYYFSEEKWKQVLRFDEEYIFFNDFHGDDKNVFFDREIDHYGDPSRRNCTSIILSDNEEWIIRIMEKDKNVEFYRKNGTSYIHESNPFNESYILNNIAEYPRLAYFTQNDTVLVGFSTHLIICANLTDFSVKRIKYNSDIPASEIFYYRVDKLNSLIYGIFLGNFTIIQFDPKQPNSLNILINKNIRSSDWEVIWIYPPKSLLYIIHDRLFFGNYMTCAVLTFLECYNYTSLTTLWWSADTETPQDIPIIPFGTVNSFRANPINDEGNFIYFNNYSKEIHYYTGELTNESEWKDPQNKIFIYRDEIQIFGIVSLISLCLFIVIHLIKSVKKSYFTA